MTRADPDRPPISTPGLDEEALSPAVEAAVDAEGIAIDETRVATTPATQTLRQYRSQQLLRIKSGESGLLPVVLALIIIVIVFEVISPNHVFISASNLVNLFQQSAVFMVLAMAETFVLLLGDIDLSAGYVGPLGGAIAVQLVQPNTTNWPWWAAIVVALTVCALIGAAQGTLITRLRLPSFIVTLAGLLIFNGVLLIVLNFGPFSGYPSLSGLSVNLHALYDLMWGHVSPLVGWIVMAIAVGLLSLNLYVRDTRRRSSGLVAPPLAVTVAKIVFIVAAGIAIVVICNLNRATVGTLEGVPYVVFIVFGLLGIWTILIQRMRYGRYIYAIGGNAEAARRSGIGVARIRTWAFVLCSLTAGIAGLLYASYLGGMSNNVNGGQLVLYAVAAAVIGGTSLFGGRGKMANGVLGGLVIGAIYNGMYLLGLQVQWEFIVTGLVLIAAVTVDALSRRGAASTGAAAR